MKIPIQKPTWVVENFTKEKSFIELTDAIKAYGSPLIHVRDNYSKSMFTNHADSSGTVVLQGSVAMLRHLDADFPKRWAGLRLPTFDNYLCSRYYSRFGDLLFNDKYVLLPLRDLQRQRFLIYGMFGRESVVFVRPDSGEKPFQAQLVDIQDLDEFCRVHEEYLHSLVLVSTPKNIEWEGRFICHKKEVIAHSTYKFQGLITNLPSVPPAAMDCCRQALEAGYEPDKVFCMDVCGASSMKEFYLLELNAFQSSGLYACDKRRIVERVNEILSNAG